ncbi:abc transporter-like protein [Diplodia corticola]|uniref:Abc transporter-like protein n=1 Tax=Diplodia corticola TaxID=236234 RepID=A0A1J9RCC3_9PEZI|nr:abc transporter-like protein [Diplodia corticola]OJD38105.1 abc transporter-like protein [Diplodia corticola]
MVHHQDHSVGTYPAGIGEEIVRTLSGESRRQQQMRDIDLDSRSEHFGSEGTDEKSMDKGQEDHSRWHMEQEVQGLRQRDEADGGKQRKLGVTWQNLTVKGVSSDATFNENVLSQYNPFGKGNKNVPMKTIIDNSHGCVKPGEMLLVLGRPGAGCTSLLSMLSNRRLGYAEITGDVKYGSMDHKAAEAYRGQIVMNTEEEIFFPALTVAQTMDFATRMKVPFHLPPGVSTAEEYARLNKEFLLKSMGISHTEDTKVGNEFIRGVSGGERKRVSIVECMATRGSVFCWDNSTRGLDASTALEWAKAMRAMTDVLGLTTIVTLYQAGNGIYNQFDKVLILDEGKQIYYGPQKEAVPFMEELGFVCDPSANHADFLTGVTVPTERRIAPGYENRFPRNADEVLAAYDRSPIKPKMIAEYNYPETEEAKQNVADFVEMTQREKHKSVNKNSPLTTGFFTQVKACVIRQYQILWGDKATFILKQVSTLAQALIAGSLFYNAPDNSGGLFVKGGALFFSLLYNSLLAMSEVTDSFSGRPVLAKHRSFALYHPAAFCIAQIAADIPVLLFQITHFGLVIYFMVGLKATAAAFFTYWVVNFAVTVTMTALFRLIGAAFPTFDAASKVSGFLVSAYIMYTGYMIAKPNMHPWFVWIFWIDPLSYGFEALLANEFHNKIIPCVGVNIVPGGPGYGTGDGGQACAGVGGAQVGSTNVTGDEYLSSLSYSHSHVWRNFGILWAWWVLFVALTIFFTTKWKQMGEGGRSLLIPREQQHLVKHLQPQDEETQATEKPSNQSASDASEDTLNNQLIRNTSVFTWKNLTYTVKTPHGDRVLLDNVQGYVKPGMLGALMGSSGAGKTTLLDVLAQRKTDGTIHGSIMVDGRPLPVSFQRSAGYVEQLDVHESLATVREALEFSALLRQSRETPREEKLRYVDTIIDLLELHDLEHTLIGRPGAGLSVEQRKRLTIGVELVSKPSILIFLDEPTSGLDGQAAYNTVRFLRKLAEVGQAVLVTIHQPSAQLFAQFDTLLLLAKGGKTVYFGDIGDNANTIKDYFGRYGAPCPPEANPAEHMIDVVSGQLSQGRDWNKVWLESPEHSKVTQELDDMIAEAASKPPGTVDDGHEFAAPMWEQVKLVTHRMNVALYRNVDYINNKVALHVGSALFNGFSFWMIGDSVGDLQLKLFTVFNFIFVAPGVIAQLQPLFIDRRDIYETREKKSKMYHWAPFVTGLVVSEIPYLIVCAVLYFVCWYYTCGFPNTAQYAGSTFFVMLMYEFVYTGIGQMIAAYAPNAVFASLVNPVIIGTLVSFCGVLVPYAQIQEFWRYWIYWLNPFNYLMGALLTFTTWEAKVQCAAHEFAVFDPPANQTCGEYLADYQQGMGMLSNLVNPAADSGCKVCQYRTGADYLYTINIKEYYYGWRDAAIVVIFVISSYSLVFGLMKLRTKATKRAE